MGFPSIKQTEEKDTYILKWELLNLQENIVTRKKILLKNEQNQ